MSDSLLDRIKTASTMLPKRQRVICEYILANPLEAGSMTIAGCSKQLNVATTTIIRLINSLGYSSYSKFKNDLRQSVFCELGGTYPDYLDVTQKSMVKSKQMDSSFLDSLLEESIESLQALRTPAFYESIKHGATMIQDAKRVFLMGLRSSRPAAEHLENGLLRCMDNIFSLSFYPEMIPDRIYRMNKDDLLLVVACQPYTKQSADALQLCHRRNIPVLLITIGPIPTDFTGHTIWGGELTNLVDDMTLPIMVDLLVSEVKHRYGEEPTRFYRDMAQDMEDHNVAIWAKKE